VRQQTAALQRQQRQQDRQALTAEVDQLFTQLSEFRKDLQAHREAIAMGVWGTLPEKPLATGHPVVAQPAVAKAQPAVAKAQPAVAKAQPKPVAKPAMVTPPASPAPVPVPVAVAVAAKPEKPQSPALEEAVYNYLHLSEGARLIEIESELGINRFQAVDALRSLIQKDLIVKEKDRTYHVQEEAVL
jgi:hypothetical protein